MRRKSMLKDYRRNKKTLSEQHLLDLYDDKKRVYDVKKKPPHQRTSDDLETVEFFKFINPRDILRLNIL
jgi:hypothetical protein